MKQINLSYTQEYATQIKELTHVPYGYVNKTICGCGLTSVALENNRNTIIAVPNQQLTTNKACQYPNDRTTNIVFPVMAGVTMEDIDMYIKSTSIVKIMITYDSLWKVEHLLATRRYDLVIDESDQLLKCTNLKLDDKDDIYSIDVLTKLFEIAKTYKDRTSFISATPIPLEYMPDWISELDQVKIEWSNTIKAKPYLMERTYPFKSIREEIIKPLQKNDKVIINDLATSKVIVFVNSVSNIIKIIKECELDSDDVAIVIGDNVKNDIKIKGYNRLQDPSKLPKFTFITSVGFQGIDLYDKDALSIVVSNTTRSFTMVDMMTDLKQAVSRQRNKTNPNYDKYVFIYNQSIFNKTEEELLIHLDKIQSDIVEAIDIYEYAKANNKKAGFDMLSKDSKDFAHYTIYNRDDDTFEMNKMAFMADKYFILETRKQFTQGFDIRGSFDSSEVVNCKIEMKKEVSFADLVLYFREVLQNSDNNISDWGVYSTRVEWIDIIEKCFKLYNKVWSNVTTAKEMLTNYNNPQGQIAIKIKNLFSVGQRYTRADIKKQLKDLYLKESINRTAKHTDLNEYFDTRELTINGERMVEIIKRK
jgi:hypothetical protein